MIRQLTDLDKQMVLEYLIRNEVETTFLYGNILEFGLENNKDIRRCADYYGFFDNGSLRGIIPFYNLGSCIPHYEIPAAIPAFIELMKENSFEFVMGMDKIVNPLYEAIKDTKKIQSYDASYYYVNKTPKFFTITDLIFENASSESPEELVDFAVEARLNGFNQTTTPDEIRKSFTQRGSEEEIILAKIHNKYVAQATVQTYTAHINQIGGVYTSLSERGKGYCKAVVSELCRRIIDRGKLPTLFVKKENTPAIKAYQSLGFEFYDDYIMIRLDVN